MNHKSVALFLTYSRLLFLIPLYFLLNSQIEYKAILTVVTIILIVMFDILDGRYAEKQGVNSQQRRIADSVIDKITIHFALLVILMTYNISLIWYLPLLIRDGSMVIFFWCLWHREKTLVYSNWFHRSALLFFALASIGIILSWRIGLGLLTTSYFLLYLTLLDYLGLYIKIQAMAIKPKEYRPMWFEGIKHLLARLA